MGIIRPPWISKEWFAKCPFNYCDHFGNKKLLAKVCKICRDDIKRNDKYKKEGKDPYDMSLVLKDVRKQMIKTKKLLIKDAIRLGIDLDNIPDDHEESPPVETYPLYNLVRKYGDQVEKVIADLSQVPIDADTTLIEKFIDILAHSQHYVGAKVARAYSSRWEEEKDPIRDELMDSKTSAFFAYIAVERNSRALLGISRHKPLRDLREKNFKFAKVSLEIADMIRSEFFPDESLIYEEFGSEDF